MLGGVAGGLAEYFGIAPVLVRVLFIIAFFLHGVGILAYIIMWIIVPKRKDDSIPVAEVVSDESSASPPPATDPELELKRRKRSNIGGFILIGLGLFFLADNFLPGFDIGNYWPLILIAIGAGLLFNSNKNRTAEV